MISRPIYHISFDLIHNNYLREDVIKRMIDNNTISDLVEATWHHTPHSIYTAIWAFNKNKRRTLRFPTKPGEPDDYHLYEFYEGEPSEDFENELYECGDIDDFLIQHIKIALAGKLNNLARVVNSCSYTLFYGNPENLPIKSMPLLDNYFNFPPRWDNINSHSLDDLNKFESEYMSALHEYALQMNRFFDFEAETCDGDLRKIWDNPDYSYIKDALYQYIEDYS